MKDRTRELLRSFAFGVALGLTVWGLRSVTTHAQEPAPAPSAAPTPPICRAKPQIQ